MRRRGRGLGAACAQDPQEIRMRYAIIMASRSERFDSLTRLLQTVPGIGEIWACIIAAEIGPFERFPNADEVLAGDMAETLRGIEITPQTYIVLITRGHQYDEPCLREVIHSQAKYIGMIGSKRRVKACFIRFRDEEGIPEELLKRVYAPIGLDIRAESPEEIALSIAAEMVKIRRGGAAQSLIKH